MAGNGTILLQTDGTTNYSLGSFDDGGAQIDAGLHTYPVDGVSTGLTTDFPPTVIAATNPVLPLAADAVTVTAAVNDRESPISSVMLSYSVNGVAAVAADDGARRDVRPIRRRFLHSRTATAWTTRSPRRPAAADHDVHVRLLLRRDADRTRCGRSTRRASRSTPATRRGFRAWSPRPDSAPAPTTTTCRTRPARSTSTDRPTTPTVVHADHARTDRRSRRTHRLHRRTAAPRHH